MTQNEFIIWLGGFISGKEGRRPSKEDWLMIQCNYIEATSLQKKLSAATDLAELEREKDESWE
jgi:hypothetical protein